MTTKKALKNIALSISLVLISVSVYAKTITIRVPMAFIPQYEDQWQDIEHLVKYSKDDIILLWKGDGGYDDIEHEFVNALQYAKKHHHNVVIKIIGDSWSNHANVMCHYDNYIFTSGSLVFHPGTWDDGTYTSAAYDKQTLDPCVKTGWITKDQENQIIYHHKAVHIYPDRSSYIGPNCKKALAWTVQVLTPRVTSETSPNSNLLRMP